MNDDDDDEYDDDDDDKLNSQLTMSMPHYWPIWPKWDVGTPEMPEMTSRALMTIKRSMVSL